MDDDEKIIEEEKKKDIEVINGDGKDLDISPVYDHIKIDKSNNQPDKKQKIVIPENKKK